MHFKFDALGQQHAIVMLWVVLMVLLQFGLAQCLYQQPLMLSQPWRFWTAHWVHLSWIHACLNILAFVCLFGIFPKVNQLWISGLLLLLSPLLSLIFYLYLPQLEAYAGLSGVLHGLYAATAILMLAWRSERLYALLVLLLLMLKLAWEQQHGALQTEQLIGYPVLVDAHLYGAILGVIAGFVSVYVQQKSV